MAQYLKPDTELGYIEDSAEIECLKMNNLRHVILGCMLGDFDEVGSYVVSPEIKKELIAMDKYVVESFDNIELCKSVLKLDKQISFMVTYEGNSATLSLIEKIHYEGNFKLNGGTYSNINEYVLDKVETSGEIDRNVLYARWHIKLVPGEIIDIFSCDESVLAKYFGIVKRFKYLLAANKTLLENEEKLEDVEAEQINEMFKILKHYPKLEQAVVANLGETLGIKKNAVNVKNPFFVKTFNEILVNAIDLNMGVLNEQEKANFLTEKHNALTVMNVKRDAIMDVAHAKVNEGEQKVILLQTDPLYENRSIQELATLFAGEHQQVIDRLNGKDNLFTRTMERNGSIVSVSQNRDQLLTNLKGLGITFGEEKQEAKETVKAASETTPAVKAEAKVEAPAKAASADKKPAAKAKASSKDAGGAKKSAEVKKDKPAAAKKSADKSKSILMSRAQSHGGSASRSIYIGKGVQVNAGASHEEDEDLLMASRIIGDAVKSKQSMTQNSDIAKNAGATIGVASRAKEIRHNTSVDLSNLT